MLELKDLAYTMHPLLVVKSCFELRSFLREQALVVYRSVALSFSVFFA